jgi:hypothetical protein
MTPDKVYKHVYTCRDCADFYDCGHELEQNSAHCDYFVLKYDRIRQIRTVGELVSDALKFKRTLEEVYKDYQKELRQQSSELLICSNPNS